MPKKRNYPKELIQEALQYSRNIKLIQQFMQVKGMGRPDDRTVRLWLKKYVPKTAQETNDYVQSVNNEYLISLIELCNKLNSVSNGEEKDRLLEEALTKDSFFDPVKLDSLLTECLKHGRLNMASKVILIATFKFGDDRRKFLDEKDSTGVLYDSVHKGFPVIDRMCELDKVISQILGKDLQQNYLETFTLLLHRAQKQAEAPNAPDPVKEDYEFLLKNGSIIFPNNIKIKNRYLNVLIGNGKLKEAKKFIENTIGTIDYESLSETDKIAYMKFRSKYIRIEKQLQSKRKDPNYNLPREIAEDSLAMDPFNLDAQLHLAHISLLEQNYSEADRRIMDLSREVDSDKKGKKYSAVEKEVVKSLRQSIMKARLEQFGIGGIIQQENAKQPVNLEESRFYKELSEMQKNIYEGELKKAEAIKNNLPPNSMNDPIVQFVKMQFFLATQNPQAVKTIFHFHCSNTKKSALPENLENGMKCLVKLSDRISESEEKIEYTLD